jgi:LTXXQ motif family protein
MSRMSAVGLTALFVMISSSTFAQSPPTIARSPETLTQAASQALADRRIDVVRVTLGLTADQARLWPAVEEAIRSRAAARHQRLVTLATRIREQREVTPIEMLLDRSDALAQRAAGLKKLADAWKPLYESLDDNQKQRLRFLAVYVLREMRDAVAARQMQSEDEEEDGE